MTQTDFRWPTNSAVGQPEVPAFSKASAGGRADASNFPADK
jgi:hypothetical protein